MDTFLTILLPIAICISLLIYFYRWSNSDEEVNDNPYKGITDKKELFTTALTKMGFEYVEDKENEGVVYFKFQGENLKAVDLDEKHHYVQIIDLWWFSEKLDNIDNVALLQKAMNMCNTRTYGTLLYTISDESGEIAIHSKIDLMLIPEINDIESHLRSQLDSLMQLHIMFFQTLQSLKN